MTTLYSAPPTAPGGGSGRSASGAGYGSGPTSPVPSTRTPLRPPPSQAFATPDVSAVRPMPQTPLVLRTDGSTNSVVTSPYTMPVVEPVGDVIIRAASCGDTIQLAALIQSEPNAVLSHHRSDDLGWTPVHYAVEFGHLDAVELLLRYFPPLLYAEDSEGYQPIVYATLFNRTDMVLLLLRHYKQRTESASDDPHRSLTIARSPEEIVNLERSLRIANGTGNSEMAEAIRLALSGARGAPLTSGGGQDTSPLLIRYVIRGPETLQEICLVHQTTLSKLKEVNAGNIRVWPAADVVLTPMAGRTLLIPTVSSVIRDGDVADRRGFDAVATFGAPLSPNLSGQYTSLQHGSFEALRSGHASAPMQRQLDEEEARRLDQLEWERDEAEARREEEEHQELLKRRRLQMNRKRMEFELQEQYAGSSGPDRALVYQERLRKREEELRRRKLELDREAAEARAQGDALRAKELELQLKKENEAHERWVKLSQAEGKRNDSLDDDEELDEDRYGGLRRGEAAAERLSRAKQLNEAERIRGAESAEERFRQREATMRAHRIRQLATEEEYRQRAEELERQLREAQSKGARDRNRQQEALLQKEIEALRLMEAEHRKSESKLASDTRRRDGRAAAADEFTLYEFDRRNRRTAAADGDEFNDEDPYSGRTTTEYKRFGQGGTSKDKPTISEEDEEFYRELEEERERRRLDRQRHRPVSPRDSRLDTTTTTSSTTFRSETSAEDRSRAARSRRQDRNVISPPPDSAVDKDRNPNDPRRQGGMDSPPTSPNRRERRRERTGSMDSPTERDGADRSPGRGGGMRSPGGGGGEDLNGTRRRDGQDQHQRNGPSSSRVSGSTTTATTTTTSTTSARRDRQSRANDERRNRSDDDEVPRRGDGVDSGSETTNQRRRFQEPESRTVITTKTDVTREERRRQEREREAAEAEKRNQDRRDGNARRDRPSNNDSSNSGRKTHEDGTPANNSTNRASTTSTTKTTTTTSSSDFSKNDSRSKNRSNGKENLSASTRDSDGETNRRRTSDSPYSSSSTTKRSEEEMRRLREDYDSRETTRRQDVRFDEFDRKAFLEDDDDDFSSATDDEPRPGESAAARERRRRDRQLRRQKDLDDRDDEESEWKKNESRSRLEKQRLENEDRMRSRADQMDLADRIREDKTQRLLEEAQRMGDRKKEEEIRRESELEREAAARRRREADEEDRKELERLKKELAALQDHTDDAEAEAGRERARRRQEKRLIDERKERDRRAAERKERLDEQYRRREEERDALLKDAQRRNDKQKEAELLREKEKDELEKQRRAREEQMEKRREDERLEQELEKLRDRSSRKSRIQDDEVHRQELEDRRRARQLRELEDSIRRAEEKGDTSEARRLHAEHLKLLEQDRAQRAAEQSMRESRRHQLDTDLMSGKRKTYEVEEGEDVYEEAIADAEADAAARAEDRERQERERAKRVEQDMKRREEAREREMAEARREGNEAKVEALRKAQEEQRRADELAWRKEEEFYRQKLQKETLEDQEQLKKEIERLKSRTDPISTVRKKLEQRRKEDEAANRKRTSLAARQQQEEDRRHKLELERSKQQQELQLKLAEARRIGDKEKEREVFMELERNRLREQKRQAQLDAQRDREEQLRLLQAGEIDRAEVARRLEEQKARRNRMRQEEELRWQSEYAAIRSRSANTKRSNSAKKREKTIDEIEAEERRMEEERIENERKRKDAVARAAKRLEEKRELEKKQKAEEKRRAEEAKAKAEAEKNDKANHEARIKQLNSSLLEWASTFEVAGGAAASDEKGGSTEHQPADGEEALRRAEERKYQRSLAELERRRRLAEKAADAATLRELGNQIAALQDAQRKLQAEETLRQLMARNEEDEVKRLERMERRRTELLQAAQRRLKAAASPVRPVSGGVKPAQLNSPNRSRKEALLKPISTIETVPPSVSSRPSSPANSPNRHGTPRATTPTAHFTREQLIERRRQYGETVRKEHRTTFGNDTGRSSEADGTVLLTLGTPHQFATNGSGSATRVVPAGSGGSSNGGRAQGAAVADPLSQSDLTAGGNGVGYRYYKTMTGTGAGRQGPDASSSVAAWNFDEKNTSFANNPFLSTSSFAAAPTSSGTFNQEGDGSAHVLMVEHQSTSHYLHTLVLDNGSGSTTQLQQGPGGAGVPGLNRHLVIVTPSLADPLSPTHSATGQASSSSSSMEKYNRTLNSYLCVLSNRTGNRMTNLCGAAATRANLLTLLEKLQSSFYSSAGISSSSESAAAIPELTLHIVGVPVASASAHDLIIQLASGTSVLLSELNELLSRPAQLMPSTLIVEATSYQRSIPVSNAAEQGIHSETVSPLFRGGGPYSSAVLVIAAKDPSNTSAGATAGAPRASARGTLPSSSSNSFPLLASALLKAMRYQDMDITFADIAKTAHDSAQSSISNGSLHHSTFELVESFDAGFPNAIVV